MFAASFEKFPFKRLRQFGQDQRGSISVLSLSLMVGMIGIGGLALDTMRIEQQRVAVQNSLDRCTLMAANMRQTLTTTKVLSDCMDKAGLKDNLSNVVGSSSTSARSISASATTLLDSLFPNVTGFTNASITTTSKAENSSGNIEIVLALDVSGSMDGQRLTDLKSAAKSFVTTVLKDDTQKRTSITLVPYNGQVNLGSAIRPFYASTYTPARAGMDCVDLTPSVFSSLSLPLTNYPMSGYNDTFTMYDPSYPTTDPRGSPLPYGPNITCSAPAAGTAASGNIVTLAGQSESALHLAIDKFKAESSTSINLGMRWALAFIDPGTRPVFSALLPATNGDGTPSALAGRPYEYSDTGISKIIVLMTDGQNTPYEYLNPAYRDGLSPIYVGSNGSNVIYHAEKTGTLKYFKTNTSTYAKKWFATVAAATGTGTNTQLKWSQVWDRFKAKYVIRKFYTDAFSGNSAYSEATMLAKIRTRIDEASYASSAQSTPTLNSQLTSVCDLAKSKKVVIYGIAFQATTGGQGQIQACASSSAHYFNAVAGSTSAGAELSAAFNTIAKNITQLKLTQ